MYRLRILRKSVAVNKLLDKILQNLLRMIKHTSNSLGYSFINSQNCFLTLNGKADAGTKYH